MLFSVSLLKNKARGLLVRFLIVVQVIQESFTRRNNCFLFIDGHTRRVRIKGGYGLRFRVRASDHW